MSPRAAIVVGLLAAFLFGSTAGLLGGFALARFGGPDFGPFAPGPRAGHMRPGGPGSGRDVRAFVEHELDLTPTQQQQFREALERQRTRMDALHDSVRAEIGRVLTPEQRERWEQMDARWRRDGPMRRGMRGNRTRGMGPGPGGPMGGPMEPPPDDSAR